MRPPKIRRRSLLLAAPALAAGCSNPLSRPFPEKTFFVLDVRRPQRLPPNPRGRVLALRTVTPAPGVELRGLVTRLAGGQQRADFWNEFFAPPASLVQDQLRTWLADSGLFSAVVDQGTRATPALALDRAAQIASLEPAAIVAGFNVALAAIFAEIEASLRAVA
ncbi:MAG: hypothetical protein MUC89_19575 [Acetobacteraceae bacterium]|nr:hypothetical protein [Acetobacteraceae bacterium]